MVVSLVWCCDGWPCPTIARGLHSSLRPSARRLCVWRGGRCRRVTAVCAALLGGLGRRPGLACSGRAVLHGACRDAMRCDTMGCDAVHEKVIYSLALFFRKTC
jgi:hypothetical protein